MEKEIKISIETLKEWIDRLEMYELDLNTSLFLKNDIEAFIEKNC